MFDRPPLTEISVEACATTLVVAMAYLEHRAIRELYLAWCAVTALVLVTVGDSPFDITIGVALVVSAWICTDRSARHALLAAGLVATALAAVRGIDIELQLAALATTAIAVPLMWHSYRTFDSATTAIVIAGTATGIYVNVPDTDQMAVLSAGLVVMSFALVLLPSLRNRPIWFGSLTLIATLVVCSGAVGARARPTAFIGVIGALGVLCAEPAASLLRRRTSAYPVVLIAVHAATVLIASRVAGQLEQGDAIVTVLAAIVGAVVVLAALPRVRSDSGSTTLPQPQRPPPA